MIKQPLKIFLGLIFLTNLNVTSLNSMQYISPADKQNKIELSYLVKRFPDNKKFLTDSSEKRADKADKEKRLIFILDELIKLRININDCTNSKKHRMKEDLEDFMGMLADTTIHNLIVLTAFQGAKNPENIQIYKQLLSDLQNSLVSRYFPIKS